MKKQRILQIGLFITFLFCYLEWGGGNSGFLFQLEYEAFSKAKEGISNILHPFILIPLAGQLLLLFTLFQKTPNRKITLIAIALMNVLALLILFVGLIDLNIRIILSTLPFILLSIYFVFANRKYADTGR